MDEVWVNDGQFMVTKPNNEPAWMEVKGDDKVLHSSYFEGPVQMGKADVFSEALASCNIGREDKVGTDLSLKVEGNVDIGGDVGAVQETLNITSPAPTAIKINQSTTAIDINGLTTIDAFGDAIFQIGTGGMTLSARFVIADLKPIKPFDIQHPTKGEGWRLRYASLEGPEAGVYCRGRVRNEKVIGLPSYWKDLVHTDSISVQLQPIGAHQDIIVKRWDDEFIYLQAQGGLPINCFYHVYAERKDCNSLLTEYEGNSGYDYPDPNFNESSGMYPEERNTKDPNYAFPRNTYTV